MTMREENLHMGRKWETMNFLGEASLGPDFSLEIIPKLKFFTRVL